MRASSRIPLAALALAVGVAVIGSCAGDRTTEPDFDLRALLNDGASDGIGNRPPTADAGLDQTVECARYLGLPVTRVDFSGQNSSDPDSIVAGYEWYVNGVLANTGVNVTIPLPLGTHTVTLRVVDHDGAADEDEVIVVVQDTQAPTISMAVSPTELGIPDGEMHQVATLIATADACDFSPSFTVTVTSNEPENGPGDANRSPDWELVKNGDGFNVLVRAERSGTGDGRVYTITATSTDASGNTNSSSGTVTVPHDKGRAGN